MSRPATGEPDRGVEAPTRTRTGEAASAILIVLALGLAFRLILAYLLPGSGFEADLNAFMKPLGIDVASPSYAVLNEGRDFQFGLTLRTSRPGAYAKLAGALSKVDAILEFRIEPY